MEKNKHSIIINNKEYDVVITKKKIRSIRYSFDGHEFHISAPRYCLDSYCLSSLNQYALKLISRYEKNRNKELPITSEYIYIFGIKYPREQFPIQEEQLNKVLKRLLLNEVVKLTRINETKMNINIPYQVSVRKMKSRWGSNSSLTHRINYSLNLVHYSLEIIESVVIHELCHDKYKDHQFGFHQELNYYCPNYQKYRYKLSKGIFQ